MTKFRTKLLLALILLIMVVFLAVGLLLGLLFKTYYANAFNERIENETLFITNYIEEIGGITPFLNNENIELINSMEDHNCTIISSDGQVLFDSNVNRFDNVGTHKVLLKNIVEEKDSTKRYGYKKIVGENELRYYWGKIEIGGKLEGFAIFSNEEESIKQANKQAWIILAVSLGASLLIIIMLGSRIATRYTRPIETATKTAIELAKGNYRARASSAQADETGKLNTSLNILARNLQEMEISREMHQDRLETLIENIGSGVLLIDNKGYITLTNRAYKHIFKVDPLTFLYHVYYEVIEHKEIISIIEEIFMTEKSMKRQLLIPLAFERRHFEVYGAPIIGNNDEWKGILVVFHDISELKKLEQMRKDFVANVSHELKTPITSIKGFSETLLDGALKDEEALKSFLMIILKESDRLQALIQELLDLSRIEQQEFELNIKPLELTPILEETRTILNGKAVEKDIELTLNTPENPVWIEGDSYRITQVFLNLMTNALTYTPNGGRVEVEVEEQIDDVIVTIRDTGIGIETEELPRIFERFYRVDKARSRDSGGTGLGLAIVKHILEVLHGEITVASEPGKGTVFTVVLKKQINK
ncbi:PAS domain-containing protein [Peribacillus psychrosaccharolyticus]|uniref:histidine kinase n=1 Tax=Peribacillus psychrosaccharolyticus TaxID=1407 RepID=A0A974NKL2_PERPY|nr:ATP-binding protein [Peribacillus psychrosaccharolyticus]MEC2054686.1 ATP-binding protein [Peribacillus psychrosaccharolyticus]MED3744087.1 ATP-binding protein [Peribacillus psychrosaccharolyticus]QQS99581.1 PAS domain-containing protein [Peribacillus psychrosaccharolyticus]